MKRKLTYAAFAVAALALLIVAFRHGDAAVAVATGALALMAAAAGINLPL